MELAGSKQFSVMILLHDLVNYKKETCKLINFDYAQL